MKLFIQIPCLNEEENLHKTIRDLPEVVEGFSSVEILIIDDGSTDRTSDVAANLGIKHIVRFNRNRGLAAAYQAGIEYCLEHGADVIVNTDADNQYRAEYIAKIVRPILDKKADVVIGARPITKIKRWSKSKKILQRLGSFVIRLVSGTQVEDATSGFRAINRDFAENLSVHSSYSYTLETVIFAGVESFRLANVPIEVEDHDMRPSRLMSSQWNYIRNSTMTILRTLIIYRSFEAFLIPGVCAIAASAVLGLRFLYYYIVQENSGHTESVILAATLFLSGLFFLSMSMVADLISVNRRILMQQKRPQQLIPRSIPTPEASGRRAS